MRKKRGVLFFVVVLTLVAERKADDTVFQRINKVTTSLNELQDSINNLDNKTKGFLDLDQLRSSIEDTRLSYVDFMDPVIKWCSSINDTLNSIAFHPSSDLLSDTDEEIDLKKSIIRSGKEKTNLSHFGVVKQRTLTVANHFQHGLVDTVHALRGEIYEPKVKELELANKEIGKAQNKVFGILHLFLQEEKYLIELREKIEYAIEVRSIKGFLFIFKVLRIDYMI